MNRDRARRAAAVTIAMKIAAVLHMGSHGISVRVERGGYEQLVRSN